jgi:transposase-like protein
MMRKTYRRFGSEFKLQLVEAYLVGEASLKGIANRAGINHSLFYYSLRN